MVFAIFNKLFYAIYVVHNKQATFKKIYFGMIEVSYLFLLFRFHTLSRFTELDTDQIGQILELNWD